MGKPIKIVDLANHMIKLSGFVPGKEIQIMFTGLRPGEKLHEELLSDKEVSKPTHNPKITIAVNERINYEELLPKIEETLDSLYKKTDQEVVSAMKEMVPEYVSSNGDYLENEKSLITTNGKRNLRKN
jgi:FlaA1/EpsC-like NDP-sugar epimerase